jgi:hypothetical protein
MVKPAPFKEELMALIIGLCGDKQHGKDTVAEILMALAIEHGVKGVRRAMADPLKEEIAACFAPRMGVTKEELIRQMNTTGEKERWRLIMQWWGTEYRRTEDKDYWVKQMHGWMKEYAWPESKMIVLVPDVRFMNEINYVLNNGGYMLRVVRPALPTDDTHASEQEWKQFNGWSQVIDNSGSMEELQVKVASLYTLLEGRGQF